MIFTLQYLCCTYKNPMALSHQNINLGSYVYDSRYQKLGNVVRIFSDGIQVNFEDGSKQGYLHNSNIYYTLESREYVKNLETTMGLLKNSYSR